MAEGALLSEEARRTVLQWESVLVTETVEKGHVRFFAEAIGDPNPLWSDELHARQSRFRGLVAPPTFLRAFALVTIEIPQLAEFSNILDSGSVWEYGESVLVGDTITTSSRVVNLMQRNLSLGPALFLVLETTYRNQFKELAAKERSTLILYKGGA